MSQSEAFSVKSGDLREWTTDGAYSGGSVIMLPDGTPGYIQDDVASGRIATVNTRGIVRVAKTASKVILPGSRIYWDHSANTANLIRGSEQDFYLGYAVKEEAASSSYVDVLLGKRPWPTISLANGFVSDPVVTAGLLPAGIRGCGMGGVNMQFETTAEAQKMDALSCQGMPISDIRMVQALICVNTNGDDAAVDFNVGLANASHASDADSITHSVFCHLDGASLNINFESDDATNETAATDSTVDFVVGTPFLVQWDFATNGSTSDIQIYVDGVNVLSGSTFDMSDASTTVMKLLAHLEKSANDAPGNYTVMNLEMYGLNP